LTRFTSTPALLVALLLLSGCPDAPLGLQVRITPSQPTQNDDLTAEIATPPTDVEDVEYAYRWFIEGSEAPGLTEATLPSSETGVGEQWRVVVIPTVQGVTGEVGAADVVIREADTSIDADGDGEARPPEGADCNDEDPTIHPGAEEVCDGYDNNCDEVIDEGFDLDSDGVTSCGGDCDDEHEDVAPGLPEVCDGQDNDCNGEPDDGFPDADDDGAAECTDCDDGDENNFPDNIEVCDGRDNNCNEAIDEDFPDSDLDSFTCDDCGEGNAAVYPGAPPLCDTTLDNDCDGNTDANELDQDADGSSGCDGDCDDADPALNTRDDDGDGVSTCSAPPDCNDADPNNFPGNVEACDGYDNDCDGVPESSSDVDGDGVTVCAGDCDDGNTAVYPGAADICDGLDNDCNGVPDEGYNDTDGDGAAYCVDCDDTDASVLPGAPEICDAQDNNCDGDVDEGFDGDNDGYVNATAPGCLAAWGSNADCNDSVGSIFPGAPPACDGYLDNNCDGIADLNEADADGDGVTVCANDCDDTWASVYPGATESCDGLDNDCDNTVDEGFDVDGDGVSTCGPDGQPGTADDDCEDTDAAIYPGAPDVCDGISDNDCDGLTDPQESDDDNDGTTECEGDCDDTTIGVGPGATEDPANGIDDDCDGQVDEAPPAKHLLELTNTSAVRVRSWDFSINDFGAVTQYNPTGNTVSAAVVGDFDGDSFEDMIVQTGSFFGQDETTLYYGNSTGGFSTATGVSNPLNLSGLSAHIWGTGDVNNDGLPDVIGWDWADGLGWVWLTDATGASWSRIPNWGSGARPFELQYWSASSTNNDHESVHLPLVDVDLDGNLDIVECSNNSSGPTDCAVHSGDGAGSFSVTYTFSLSRLVNGFAIADYDNDGLLDLVGGLDDDGDAGQAWIWTGGLTNWSGSGSEAFDVNNGSGTNAQNAAGYGWAYPMDVDQNGTPDIVMSIMTPFGSNNRTLYYALSSGTGSFALINLGSSQGQHGGNSYIIQDTLGVAPAGP